PQTTVRTRASPGTTPTPEPRRPAGGRTQNGPRRYFQTYLRPGDDAGQNVPADAVCSQPVRPARWLHAHAKIRGIQIVGRDTRSYQGNDNIKNEYNPARHGAPVTAGECSNGARNA